MDRAMTVDPRQEDDFTVTGDELDLCLARAETAEARVVELTAALREAVDEVLNGKVGSYGACVSYTPTILAETVESWAVLAAAGEGEANDR